MIIHLHTEFWHSGVSDNKEWDSVQCIQMLSGILLTPEDTTVIFQASKPGIIHLPLCRYRGKSQAVPKAAWASQAKFASGTTFFFG